MFGSHADAQIEDAVVVWLTTVRRRSTSGVTGVVRDRQR